MERPIFSLADNYPYYKYPFKMFNPLQTKVRRIADQNANMIISAATSAGKTVCAEMIIDHGLQNDGTAMYLSPLKALTAEKLEDWAVRFKDYNMEIMTGDQTLSERQETDLENADIILMTSEMLDSRTRNIRSDQSQYLKNITEVIVDEAHIIGTSRGGALECGLIRLCEINPNIKIVFLSATMPNVQVLADWLTTLTNKPTNVIQTTWRPVQLNLEVIPHISSTYGKARADKINKAIELAMDKPEEKFLIFVHDKNTGKLMAEQFEKEHKMFVPFHSADLTKNQRQAIEKSFKDKTSDLRVIIATSTLAWGVNLPARNVIITGLHRGQECVDSADIIQMVGRAGRIGLDTEGFVTIISPLDKIDWIKEKIYSPDPVESTLTEPSVLQFQTLSEIRNKIFITPKGFQRWFTKTLAHAQGMSFTDKKTEELFQHLAKIRMVKFDPEEDDYELEITNLGVVSAVMYYDPNIIFSWYMNFNNLFSTYSKAGRMPQAKDIPEPVLAYCLGATYLEKDYPASDVMMYMKKLQPILDKEFFSEITKKTGFVPKLINASNVMGAFLAMGNESFFPKFQIPSSVNSAKYTMVKDMGRIITTLRMIDSNYAMWKIPFWKELSLKVATGLPWHIVAFAELPGVGQTKAQKLYECGFRSVDQVMAEGNFSQASKVLGAKTYSKAREAYFAQKKKA